MDKENMKIDFKDLMKHIGKSSKKIIVVLIVGFVLGAGLCFATGKNKMTTAPSNAELLIEADNYKANLTNEQADNIYDNYQTYAHLRDLKQQIMAMSNSSSSFLNNLNSTGKQMRTVYSVSSDHNSSAVAYAYESLIMNENVYDQIRNKIGSGYTNDMIDQLVNIETTMNSSSNNVSVNVDNSKSESLKVTVFGNNRQICTQLNAIVQKRITALKNSMTKKYGNFNLIYAGSNISNINRDDIVKIKLSYTSQIDSLSTSMKNITDSITDEDQANYFNALLKIGKKNKSVAVTSKKNIILFTVGGGIALAIIYIIILMASYVCSSKLHTSSNFKQLFHIEVLADLNDGDDERIHNELKLFHENNNGKTLIVSSNKDLDLKSDLNLANDEYAVLNGIPVSENDYDLIKECHQVVLYEKVNSSKINEIDDVISYYKDHHVPVKGAIIIR